MSVRRRTHLRWLILALLGLSVLSACTVSVSGGLVGGGLAGFLGLLLIFSAGASQTGCAEDSSPTPEPESDASVSDDAQIGPCLSAIEPDIGPCLGAPLMDMGRPDSSIIGPCLSAPLEDMGPPVVDAAPDQGEDARFGPCLDVPADAFLLDPDAGIEDAGPDVPLGPCLSPPQGDFGAQNLPPPHGADPNLPSVDEIRAKVLAQGTLPPDVVARLKGENV